MTSGDKLVRGLRLNRPRGRGFGRNPKPAPAGVGLCGLVKTGAHARIPGLDAKATTSRPLVWAIEDKSRRSRLVGRSDAGGGALYSRINTFCRVWPRRGMAYIYYCYSVTIPPV